MYQNKNMRSDVIVYPKTLKKSNDVRVRLELVVVGLF